jgi:hypothetical protein
MHCVFNCAELTMIPHNQAFPALLRAGMGGAFGWGEPTNRKESMQTPTEQPPSPSPEAPPAGRLRPERKIVIAELAFCAAFAVAGAILLRRPDRMFDPAALHEWFSARSAWTRVILSATMLVCLAAELDLLGRVIAAPLARIVHGRHATPQQSACLRLVAQTAFTALVVIGPLVAPTVFPSFHGWILAVFLVALALPIGRSIADCQMRCF